MQMLLTPKDLSFVGYTYKNFDAVKGLHSLGMEFISQFLRYFYSILLSIYQQVCNPSSLKLCWFYACLCAVSLFCSFFKEQVLVLCFTEKLLHMKWYRAFGWREMGFRLELWRAIDKKSIISILKSMWWCCLQSEIFILNQEFSGQFRILFGLYAAM